MSFLPAKEHRVGAIVLVCFVCALFQAVAAMGAVETVKQSRIVNSKEERERLLGWDSQVEMNKRFEKERLSDVGEVEKKRRLFQKEQEKDLLEYRKAKAKQAAQMDDSGKEYKADLQRRVNDYMERDKLRERFVQSREEQRRLGRSKVSLTEDEELGLIETRQRVPWDQRDVLSEKQAGGAARPSVRSSSPPAPRNNDFIPPEFDSVPPPPPPMSPPPEFFEPDMLPGEGFDLPPPPPIEEGVPPPIFEDEF